MSYHNWNDNDFDWKGLNDCLDILDKYGRGYGRIGGQIKEKFGGVRWYASLGYLSLHGLIYPSYNYSKFPQWLWVADIKYITPFLQFFFSKPFFAYQKFWYNYAYQKCLKKHPHLRDEILSSADHSELIK